MLRILCLAAILCLVISAVCQAEPPVKNWKGDVLTIGRDDVGDPLSAMLSPETFSYDDNKLRVLTVIDVGADPNDYTKAIQRLETLFQNDTQPTLKQAWICISPEAVPGKIDRTRLLAFPPKSPAYHTTGERTAAAVWRFITWYAPDLIVEVHSNRLPGFVDFLSGKPTEWESESLAYNASQGVMGWGSVPSVRMSLDDLVRDDPPAPTEWNRMELFFKAILTDLTQPTPSPLHAEVVRRQARSAATVVDQLLNVYGSDLKTVMYQPALAVVARHQRAQERQDGSEIKVVEQILKPYLSGAKPALSDNPNGSQFAGHLIFADWARRTKDAKAIKLVRKVADFGFDAQGNPLEAMPTHSEMSDAVFMGCPILTSAAELTAEAMYLDMAGRHLQFMRRHCHRDDGLYRHSPLCEAAWGRGNGFPALGLALCLTDLDAILNSDSLADLHPAARNLREVMLRDFREHCKALLPHQDMTGMWRQVIDDPRAYREMTATCMIGFAMQRGLNHGWLSGPQYAAAVDRAWQAAKVRISPSGELLDVCTGTGKQKTLEDYFDRTATTGVDERGGAMALLFARERERSEK